MNSERLIGAVSKLSGVALEYPELSSGVTEMISGLLQMKKDTDFELNPTAAMYSRTNGHINGTNWATVATAVKEPHTNSVNGHVGNHESHITHRLSEPPARRPSHADAKTDGLVGDYTKRDAAVILGVCENTVRNWIARGKLAATKKRGVGSGLAPAWVISADELKRFKACGPLSECGCRNK